VDCQDGPTPSAGTNPSSEVTHSYGGGPSSENPTPSEAGPSTENSPASETSPSFEIPSESTPGPEITYPPGTTPSSSGGGGCDYPKDNVSWGEYQTKIPMPDSATSPYTVKIKFDATTEIGKCHSNCGPITCVNDECTFVYTGTIPVELFNVKKMDSTGDSDRSNIISVTVNGEEQC